MTNSRVGNSNCLAIFVALLSSIAFPFGVRAEDGYAFKPITVSISSEYTLLSCCTKGCGGACCRCGRANGYLSDCSTSCGVCLSELKKMAALEMTSGLVVKGRLLHESNKSPLQGEVVSLMIPGGQVITTKTEKNGNFIISILSAKANDTKAATLELGNLPSVSAKEREQDEDAAYELFLVPKSCQTSKSE